MDEIISFIAKYVKIQINNAGSSFPISNIKTVFDGKPKTIDQNSGVPCIRVGEITDSVEYFGGYTDNSFEIEIGVLPAPNTNKGAIYERKSSECEVVPIEQKKFVRKIIGQRSGNGKYNQYTLRGMFDGMCNATVEIDGEMVKIIDSIYVENVEYSEAGMSVVNRQGVMRIRVLSKIPFTSLL